LPRRNQARFQKGTARADVFNKIQRAETCLGIIGSELLLAMLNGGTGTPAASRSMP